MRGQHTHPDRLLLCTNHCTHRVLGAHPGAAYGYKVALKETLPQHLLYDLVVDPLDAYVLTADQNGIMRQWDAASGRVLRTMQPEVGAGEVGRVGVVYPDSALCLLCPLSTP